MDVRKHPDHERTGGPAGQAVGATFAALGDPTGAQKTEGVAVAHRSMTVTSQQNDMRAHTCTGQQLAAWGRRLGMAPGAMEAWAVLSTHPMTMVTCYGVAKIFQVTGTIFVHIGATPSGLRVQVPAAANAVIGVAFFGLYWRSGPRQRQPIWNSFMSLAFVLSFAYLWMPVRVASDALLALHAYANAQHPR
jgi:hypothetical protein